MIIMTLKIKRQTLCVRRRCNLLGDSFNNIIHPLCLLNDGLTTGRGERIHPATYTYNACLVNEMHSLGVSHSPVVNLYDVGIN